MWQLSGNSANEHHREGPTVHLEANCEQALWTEHGGTPTGGKTCVPGTFWFASGKTFSGMGQANTYLHRNCVLRCSQCLLPSPSWIDSWGWWPKCPAWRSDQPPQPFAWSHSKATCCTRGRTCLWYHRSHKSPTVVSSRGPYWHLVPPRPPVISGTVHCHQQG